MKKICSFILLLLAASAANAGDMYRCVTEDSVLYQATPCGGEKISFAGGTLVSEGAKLQEPASAIVPSDPEIDTPEQTVPKSRTIKWALELYSTAASKARKCQQSLQTGLINPCIDFANFTQGDSDFMNAYQYLVRYDTAGLDNILDPAERDTLARDSSDILKIAGQLEKMIQLAQ